MSFEITELTLPAARGLVPVFAILFKVISKTDWSWNKGIFSNFSVIARY